MIDKKAFSSKGDRMPEKEKVPALLLEAMFIGPLLLIIVMLFVTAQVARKHFSWINPTAHAIAQAHVSSRCAKCDGLMEAGYVIDGAHSSSGISTWNPGTPKISQIGTLKNGNEKLVVTFRCAKCGFVESYTK